MNIHLVFPPVWLTESPYLSVPALRAYLGRLPGVVIRSMDLNIQLWRHLRSDESLIKLHSWARSKLEGIPVICNRGDLDAVLCLRSVAAQGASDFVLKVRDRGIPRSVLQSSLKMYFQESMFSEGKAAATEVNGEAYDYYDPFMNLVSLSSHVTTAEQLLGTLKMGDGGNPYLKLMPELYGQLAPVVTPADIVAISVVAVNQAVPALALSDFVKKQNPRCRVVWGGQWITQLFNEPRSVNPLFDVIDGLIVGEGEVPLFELVKAEMDGRSWENVPNLLYRTSGMPVRTKVQGPAHDLDDLPAPDYDGMPIEEYDFPHSLSLQASRGCSWRHCQFCSYAMVDPIYKERSASKVVGDIEQLIARHGVKEIAFTDSIMEPSHFLKISDEIIARKIQVRWRGFGRFDRKLTKDVLARMAQAGCCFIIWGLESGSNHVLKLMKKGTSQVIIQQNLCDAAASGIHNRVCLIYGYPGETRSDFEESLSFVERNLASIHSMALSPFTMVRGTPVSSTSQNDEVRPPELGSSLNLNIAADRRLGEQEYLRMAEQKLRTIHLVLERLAM